MKRKRLTWLAAAAGAGTGAFLISKNLNRRVPDTPFLQHTGVLRFAHRGGEALWPPNTLFAFQHAAALGVDALETDLHATSDGALVLSHDPTVDQNTDGTGFIKSFTLAEIKALDAGYRWTPDGGQTFPFRGQGITIPTLEEVLLAFPTMRVNIDIKQAEPSIVEPFAELLYRLEALDRVLVGSFHDTELARFRQLCPEVPTAAGVQETRIFYILSRAGLSALYTPRFHAFQVPEYANNMRIVSPGFIKAAHAHNIQVHVWTVNDAADMQRLVAWGVDGLISDYPDKLMEVTK